MTILINNINLKTHLNSLNFANSKITDLTTISTTTTMTTKFVFSTLSTLSILINHSTTTLTKIAITTNKRSHSQYGLSVLRILRLTRVLRVLKLSRHVRALQILGQILYECLYEIILLITFLAMNIVIFSSFMYFIELHALSDASPFLSIPHAFWWAVISFTTIGYGKRCRNYFTLIEVFANFKEFYKLHKKVILFLTLT